MLIMITVVTVLPLMLEGEMPKYVIRLTSFLVSIVSITGLAITYFVFYVKDMREFLRFNDE